MSARPKDVLYRIEARAVTAPRYDNENLSRSDWWVADNISILRDHWHSLPGEGNATDWKNFCLNQWERETTRQSGNANTLRQYP